MKFIKYPNKEQWNVICKRNTIQQKSIEETVQTICNDVLVNKDKALLKYAQLLDNVTLESLVVSEAEIKEALAKVSQELKDAITVAKTNITKFHESQKETVVKTTTITGVTCWRKSVAIEKVGLYIPGGSAPLFSTILMLAIPAKIAGCKELVLCTPPNKEGKINPAILYTANLLSIDKIYKVGGAQAIAAMAYGTGTIPKVDKIFGPGNQFVTKAKELMQRTGVAIDMPAGPSEVLVIADASADASFIAADLLSQAEHGADSQAILVTNSLAIAEKTLEEIKEQIAVLPRKNVAEKALDNSAIVVLNSIDECVAFSNIYAPEHLIIASDVATYYLENIENAGSVFIGNYSCESLGDYASGTNHTLPTNGYARSYSGVSVDSFVKKITFQQVSKEGILNLGKTVEIMAEAEGLQAHKNAVSIRLKSLA